ncbi:MAG TPA: alpha-N-arabinofuranosidase, partial [Edaphobacter sp.]|nr:alpha-N-arabinofuranosidase [Edaphobacter sp.]
PAGATNIQVTSLSNISAGDKIRLDIDSSGHGIETVTVKHVGTAAHQTNLSAPAKAGATQIRVRRGEGFAAGDKITVGTPASKEVVTVTAVGTQGPEGTSIEISPALTKSHIASEWVVAPGTGLDLESPLGFNHAANLPFSDRGTGISFQPATTFAHSSNEPVQALGTGITLDQALVSDHEIHAPVRDRAVKTAGYQGAAEPNLWYGGPEFTTKTPQFDRILTVEEGSIILRDASGVVADSLNYGGLVDPWAAEGDQSVSGARLSGCYSPAPGSAFTAWSTIAAPVAVNTSSGRFPDGSDIDSNCADFHTQAAASVSADLPAGSRNIKVATTDGFQPGQTIHIDSGPTAETALIVTVGTPGASTLRSSIGAGAKVLPVANVAGFSRGENVTIGEGASSETAVISGVRTHGDTSITVSAPLNHEHATGTQVSGSGITLAAPLKRSHTSGTQIFDDVPTPGAPNQYHAGNVQKHKEY